jgi:hypothetical protein
MMVVLLDRLHLIRELPGTNSLKEGAVWNVDPFLGNDRERSRYTTAVTRQQAVNSNRGTLFSKLSVPRCYKQGQSVG